jgi:hypothetical protein
MPSVRALQKAAELLKEVNPDLTVKGTLVLCAVAGAGLLVRKPNPENYREVTYNLSQQGRSFFYRLHQAFTDPV